MSTFENFWNQLDAPAAPTEPLSRKESQFQLLDKNTDKLNLSPDEEYKMGWGADALPEDWIDKKAKEIQKNIDESSSVAVLRKGAEQRAQAEAADGPMAKAASALTGVAASTGGNGGPRTDHNPNWTSMSDADKAGYYADNPTMSKITQLGQAGFGLTNLGKLQAKYAPDFVRQQEAIARGEAFGEGGPSFGNVNLSKALDGLGPGDISQLGVSLGQFGDTDSAGDGDSVSGGAQKAGGYNTGVGSYGGSLWGGGVGGSHSIGG